MLAGYRHQISFLVSNLEQNIDHLESTVVTGSQDESVIKPKMDQVQKAMEKYQQGMKTIKAAFVLCLIIAVIIRVIVHATRFVYWVPKAPPKEKKPKAAAKKASSGGK